MSQDIATAMDTVIKERIVNEHISPSQYLLRRTALLERIASHADLHNSTQALMLFDNNDNLRLTFQEIREKEMSLESGGSTPRDFRGVGESGQKSFTFGEYQQALSHARKRSRDLIIATGHTKSVFRSSAEPLEAMEVFRRERYADIDPLSVLPTTHNVETVDDSTGTGDLMSLKVVSWHSYTSF